jgi:hypothetical protein
MPLPNQPVTLTAAQVAELNNKLSAMRHHINNKLAVIVGALEVIRMKPESAERIMKNLGGQPLEIRDAIEKFSADFDQTLGVTRP